LIGRRYNKLGADRFWENFSDSHGQHMLLTPITRVLEQEHKAKRKRRDELKKKGLWGNRRDLIARGEWHYDESDTEMDDY
ncbi:hypothetical protein V5O48_019608, partial [Marasmius crinis-equi]